MKEAGCELHFQTCSLDQISKSPSAIAPVVACDYVCLGPQGLIRRNGQIDPSLTRQVGMDCLQELVIVLDMFHHVEQTDCGETSGDESGVLQCGERYLLDSPPTGVHRARCSRFHEYYFQSRVLHRFRYEAVAAANVEERTGRWKLAYGFEDAGVAMLEPEGGILDVETRLIAPFRVRNGRLRPGAPAAFSGLLKVAADLCQIDHRGNTLS